MQVPGKNKILICAYDISGSMSGSPTTALKMGAQLIGDKYYGAEQRPFEQFFTILYNHTIDVSQSENHEQYKQKIESIRAGGGTNFMNVFTYIQSLLDANPNCEELCCIFITDGQDGYYSQNGRDSREEYDEVSVNIKSRPNLKTKFLSVGFSRGHDAVFMNRIANFGTDIGNFIFIDSYNQGWQDNLQQSLLDSLEIALESSAKVKFAMANPPVGYEQSVPAETQYVMREEEEVKDPQQENAESTVQIDTGAKKQGDEDDILDILLTHQEVVKAEVLSNTLVLRLVTTTGETDLEVEFETQHDPRPEILLQASLQFAKTRLFKHIQDLQQKTRKERLEIYQLIK